MIRLEAGGEVPVLDGVLAVNLEVYVYNKAGTVPSEV